MPDEIRIDPASWQVRLLPHPARFSRSKALGFCGGHPVGMAETARARSQACWWPDGEPELLALDGYKDLRAQHARGDSIPGTWSKGSGSASGASVWRLRDGTLRGANLHDTRFERTWAECAEHGLVLGAGVHEGRMGARPADSGLVWREDGTCHEIAAAGDVCLRGTDGTRLVGCVDGRATMWPAFDAAPVDLGPEGYGASDAYAIDGDTQAGVVYARMAPRAALWRGGAGSFVDLTPEGYECGSAVHAVGGWQVGFVRRSNLARNGSSSLADQAALWRGSADTWLDLNALLHGEGGLNASAAWSIVCDRDSIQVCGEASRYEVSDGGTDRESHFVPTAKAVVWTARILKP